MHKLADKDSYIMVTWANDYYFDFVQNWVEHVEELGISAYVVGAMDNKILRKLVLAGIPCFAMQSGLTARDFGWGSKNFHAMVRTVAPCCALLLRPAALLWTHFW
jgi:arabinosyltransferase